MKEGKPSKSRPAARAVSALAAAVMLLFVQVAFGDGPSARIPAISASVQPEAAASSVNTGDTAWMLMSAALVMLMTPGLALFYTGGIDGLLYGNPLQLWIQVKAVLIVAAFSLAGSLVLL